MVTINKPWLIFLRLVVVNMSHNEIALKVIFPVLYIIHLISYLLLMKGGDAGICVFFM